jgi:hypothetical protein
LLFSMYTNFKTFIGVFVAKNFLLTTHPRNKPLATISTNKEK